MRGNTWPNPYREWVQQLPTQLGPRKFRLLVTAWCRNLLVSALEKQVVKDTSSAFVQGQIVAALEASDRFADTGKTKKALSDSLKNLKSIGSVSWPFPANTLLVLLFTKDPALTLYHCAVSWQMFRQVPLEDVVAELRQIVSDLSPPAERDGASDPSFRSPDVLELAQSIYQRREFHRMQELANALESAGCQDRQVVDHCRNAKAIHIRGCWVLDGILDRLITKPKVSVLARGSLKRQDGNGFLDVMADIMGENECHPVGEIGVGCSHRRKKARNSRPAHLHFSKRLYGLVRLASDHRITLASSIPILPTLPA